MFPSTSKQNYQLFIGFSVFGSVKPRLSVYLFAFSPVHDTSSLLTGRADFEVLSAVTATPTIDETEADEKLNVLLSITAGSEMHSVKHLC